MVCGFQFSQGEPAEIHRSHFPGLRYIGRLCSVQLSCMSPIFLLLFTQKMRCWRRVPSSGTSLCVCCSWSLVWTFQYHPICSPLNGAVFQIYLLIIAYSCLHYKYFWKAPLITPQFHLPHCNYQIVVVYSYCNSICRSGCGTGNSRARCWEKINIKYSYFLILFLLTFENKTLAIQWRQQPTYEIQPLKNILFFCGF